MSRSAWKRVRFTVYIGAFLLLGAGVAEWRTRGEHAQLRESKLEALGGTVSKGTNGIELHLISPLTHCAVGEIYTDADLDGHFEERTTMAWQGWNKWSIRTRQNVLDSDYSLRIASGELPKAHALELQFPEDGNPALTISSAARSADGARHVYKDFDADGHFDVQTIRAQDGSRSIFILLARRWTAMDTVVDAKAFVASDTAHGARWYRFEAGQWRLDHESAEDTPPTADPVAP